MKINAKSINEYLYSIDDELSRIVRNHTVARHAIILLMDVFNKSKGEHSWMVAKALLDISNLIDDNFEPLSKMQFSLSKAKARLSFLAFIRFFFKLDTIAPSLGGFSRLLEKVITNLEKAFDDLRTLFLPVLSQDKEEYTQSLVIMLKEPFDKITESMNAAHNIQELLSQIRDTSEEQQESSLSGLEKDIYENLFKAIPSAALAYKQAVDDLANRQRVSYRGVANEFREALRETLDHLAPDDKVKAQPNFKFDPGKTAPTMKQKARYILRARGTADNAAKVPEEALEIIEGRIASFARATYDRSSISTHIASERNEVQQIKYYTNAILAELLKIGT